MQTRLETREAAQALIGLTGARWPKKGSLDSLVHSANWA